MSKFVVGDLVHHLSNIFQGMVVVEVSELCVCRWVDKEGHVCMQEFIVSELEYHLDA